MSKLTQYLEKRQLLQSLSSEVKQLENDEALQRELAFEADLRRLMSEFDVTPQKAMDVLFASDPALNQLKTQTKGTRPKRQAMVFVNPHTGIRVKTHSWNHTVLRKWKAEHGAEAVASWQQTD